MTLVQFFERLLEKLQSIEIPLEYDPELPDFAQDKPGDVDRYLKELIEHARVFESQKMMGSRTYHSTWSLVVKKMKPSGAFEEFVDDVALREELKAFLAASDRPTPIHRG